MAVVTWGQVVCVTAYRERRAAGHPREGALAYARLCGRDLAESGVHMWCDSEMNRLRADAAMTLAEYNRINRRNNEELARLMAQSFPKLVERPT